MADLTFEERLVALEERKLKLDDLPLADIIKKIELQGLDVSALPPLFGGAFAVYDGVIGTTVPAAGTGVPFSVAAGGQYLCIFSATAFVAVAGTGETITHYIDGASIAVQPLFFNVANQHLAFPTRFGITNLTPGTHFWGAQQSAGLTTNAGDHAAIAVVRIG